MKKVAVMGLVDWENYGEQFLAKSVVYLVGEKYNTKPVDFEPSNNRIGYLVYWMMIALTRICPFKKKPYVLMLFGVRVLTQKYFTRELKECDAVIFACGSYKYRTQKLWAYYSIAIETAQKLNIPVMFDAMNIQDFDENDWRCRCLKEHTNYSCVKMFTTRDGEPGKKKLQTCYLDNSDIEVFSVGDPAFWIPECYGVKKAKEAGIIGINLIRGRIFADYGYATTEAQLVDLYCNMIRKFEECGVEWEFFTNGMEADYLFGKNVLKKCNMNEGKIRVPQSDRELVEMIAGYRGIIGARLHACICAYSLDVPLAGYIWDEKLLRFAEIAGLRNVFLEEKELTSDNIYEKLQLALKSSYNKELRDSWKLKTRDSIQRFLTSLKDQQ